MSKKPAADNKKGTTVIANDPEDRKGRLKSLGGSQSDNWNNILANQTVQTLWVAHSEQETKDRQYSATVAALVGIGPKDELEGMIAAQLIAAHNAAMECYRRAMIGEQTLRGPTREPEPSQQAIPHLCHAARGAQPSSRQGPAEGHGRARPRARWRPSGRRHGRDPGGRGSTEIRGSTPCKANCPCTSAPDVAHGREAEACAGRRAMPNGRCRLHGGLSPGAPKGNKNAFKHGRYTAEATARRRDIASLLRSTRRLAKDAE